MQGGSSSVLWHNSRPKSHLVLHGVRILGQTRAHGKLGPQFLCSSTACLLRIICLLSITVTYDDNNDSKQMHLYQEEYKFLPEDNAGEASCSATNTQHGMSAASVWFWIALSLPVLCSVRMLPSSCCQAGLTLKKHQCVKPAVLCCAATPPPPAGPMPDLLQHVITADSPTGQKVTGEVIHYDGLMHTGKLSHAFYTAQRRV
jgi:hypothetical protein